MEIGFENLHRSFPGSRTHGPAHGCRPDRGIPTHGLKKQVNRHCRYSGDGTKLKTMKALLVFESMFGNTQAVATAIGDGLSSYMSVEMVEVGGAPGTIPDDVDLLVVGGPTHGFGLARKGTRKQAATETDRPLVSAGRGIREWMDAGLRGSEGVYAITFDTAFKRLRRLGTAGRAAQRRLRRLGFRTLGPSESFFVEETTGPLREGELERARKWGEDVGAELAKLSARRDVLRAG
jgi:hypothetical protein